LHFFDSRADTNAKLELLDREGLIEESFAE
jgi:hypothetical protein